MRSTRTYAILHVPAAVYAAVRAHLRNAAGGDTDAVTITNDGEILDMHGIALSPMPGDGSADVRINSMLSGRTKEGAVEFSVNGELVQMDLTKAREIVGMFHAAIEAAASDQLLFQFLTTKIRLSPEAAAAALSDFREMRHGSKDTVYPS